MNIEKDKLINKLNIDILEDDNIVILTEAPTQNIIAWSSRKYEQNNVNSAILQMISTGYHDTSVWRSVIFQLQTAIYVLHKKNICIYNFNLENNVYIKDTNYDNNNIGYWKYKINGVEFFVPNYGSIVLIDSNFFTSFKLLFFEISFICIDILTSLSQKYFLINK